MTSLEGGFLTSASITCIKLSSIAFTAKRSWFVLPVHYSSSASLLIFSIVSSLISKGRIFIWMFPSPLETKPTRDPESGFLTNTSFRWAAIYSASSLSSCQLFRSLTSSRTVSALSTRRSTRSPISKGPAFCSYSELLCVTLTCSGAKASASVHTNGS